MNADIARQRINAVAKADSIYESESDFLATHVPVQKLQSFKTYIQVPPAGSYSSEEQIFQEYICNPQDIHQYILVYGQSGTGKSHLIRWFAARFRENKPENEVVLFLSRSDRTLKGTLRQLMKIPEVQNIPNKDVYDRLLNASLTVEENVLKDTIYHQFLILVRNDDGEYDRSISNVTRKRLVAFLSNEIVHNQMMEANGPVERIYAKIAESTALVDRDLNAEFLPGDFEVDDDLAELLEQAGADRNAVKLANSLMSDLDGEDTRAELADYLNQFVQKVIQSCAGIQPGDLEDVFRSIRHELYNNGKNLTLFIEDVSSMTGVDQALLNALIVEHTDANERLPLCRLSSIIGSTGSYVDKYFLDNHRQRITQCVYIPDAVFEGAQLYAFFGRYLNAMSLPNVDIQKWMAEGASPSTYPVHVETEGKLWDHVQSENASLGLFPFSKRSIDYFYQYSLSPGHKTPRFILQNIIEPVVKDYLYHSDQFPTGNYTLHSTDAQLPFIIRNNIADSAEADRIHRFLCIWGDGTPNQYTDNGITYRAGLRTEVFEELNLPVFDLVIGKAPKIENADSSAVTKENVVPASQNAPENPTGPAAHVIKKVNEAGDYLAKWLNEKKISITSTGGIEGTVSKARTDLVNYLFSSINWQARGISMDHVDKVSKSSLKAVILEGERAGRGLWTLAATQESTDILKVFLRWREFGKQSWGYDSADFDVFQLTKWTERIVDSFAKAVVSVNEKESHYIDAAICAHVLGLVLNGQYPNKSLDSIKAEFLFQQIPDTIPKSMHAKEWTSLQTYIHKNGACAQNAVKDYFNIVQGKSTSVVVLDNLRLEESLRRTKRKGFLLTEEDLQLDDPVKLRHDLGEYYGNLVKQLDGLVVAEKKKAQEILDTLKCYFEVEELDEVEDDDIISLYKKANDFYTSLNENQINISASAEKINQQIAEKYVRGMKNLEKGILAESTLESILWFSGDPMLTINPMLEYLGKLEGDLEKAESKVSAALEKYHNTDGLSDNLYIQERALTEKSFERMKELMGE